MSPTMSTDYVSVGKTHIGCQWSEPLARLYRRKKQKKGKKAPKGTDPKGLNLATPQLIMRWVTITNEREARSTDGVHKTPKNRKNLVGTYEGMTE